MNGAVHGISGVVIEFAAGPIRSDLGRGVDGMRSFETGVAVVELVERNLNERLYPCQPEQGAFQVQFHDLQYRII